MAAPGTALAVKVISISVSAAISPVTFEVFGLAAIAGIKTSFLSASTSRGIVLRAAFSVFANSWVPAARASAGLHFQLLPSAAQLARAFPPKVNWSSTSDAVKVTASPLGVSENEK